MTTENNQNEVQSLDEEEFVWETLITDNDYEICTQFPYQIRRKSNGYIISEWENKAGYLNVNLNGKLYGKHRLIAEQFIENDDPEKKVEVDHINKNRTDYHIENLRWVTPSQNGMNKSSYNGVECEYVDDLPLDTVPIIWYNGFEFDGYFIDHDGEVWYDTGEQFRKLYVNKKNQICIRDIYHKRHDFGIKGLRREFL